MLQYNLQILQQTAAALTIKALEHFIECHPYIVQDKTILMLLYYAYPVSQRMKCEMNFSLVQSFIYVFQRDNNQNNS